MPGEQNDLLQLKQARGILASVYKTQATDAKVDNGNLTEINTAILCLNNAIAWLKKQEEEE